MEEGLDKRAEMGTEKGVKGTRKPSAPQINYNCKDEQMTGN